jgi:hypothetical protein
MTRKQNQQYLLNVGYETTRNICKFGVFEQHQQIGVIFVTKSEG